MKCPFCGSTESSVVDSRMIEDGAATRRRRKCGACNARFTTYERYCATPLMVVKRNNRREPFDRDKVRAGIIRACNKREISLDLIERMVDEIEQEVREVPNSEIKAEYVGELVLERLKDIDEIAYVRFASVYKHYDDISAFVHEVFALESTFPTTVANGGNGGNGGNILTTGVADLSRKELLKTLNKHLG